ncbi:hypothetical protein DYB32_004406 [Aphanomyces invadans]|uniref:Uncharacterized protein n=1 Tax=Aphanomyces invadans TaxID=157072 RepID=A0A418AXK9_9STRA|nr:hypothetical protein DYB32_004406 [Aphanomyces invadans]
MTQAAVLDDDSWISKSNWHRIDGMTGSDQDKLSLRYLDEFVGDLTCSAQMLAWGLFPDAKEVTEIRIRLRKAIVVLVHAHVTIEQAMCAIDATEIIAVLTLPWHFQRDWRVGVIGRHDELVHALSRLGFTAIDSIEAEDDISTLTWHVLLDCGNLHRALNRTDKTKSGYLVGHLCQRWQTWLVDAPGAAVVIVSSRRMLRSRKFLNR